MGGATRFFGALALLVCGASASAFAQEAKPSASASASAQLQFVAGRERFKAHDYKNAAENFKRALAVSGSPNASFYLARCMIELGNLLGGYEMMQRSMNDAGAKVAVDPEYAQTRDAAKAELDGLERRIGHVTIQLISPPPDAQITVNGRALDPARFSQPVAVAPGHVVVVASASGRDTAKGEADVGAGESKSIQLLLGGGSAIAGPAPSTTEPTAPVVGETSNMRKAGFVVAGLGVVGLAIFVGTDIAASSDYSTLKNECVGHCTKSQYDSVISHGKTLETVSNVGLVIGIAGIVGGGALIYLGGSKSKPSASIGASPTIGGAALRFTQSF